MSGKSEKVVAAFRGPFLFPDLSKKIVESLSARTVLNKMIQCSKILRTPFTRIVMIKVHGPSINTSTFPFFCLLNSLIKLRWYRIFCSNKIDIQYSYTAPHNKQTGQCKYTLLFARSTYHWEDYASHFPLMADSCKNRVDIKNIQSTLSKTDTFGTGTKCPS